MSEVGVNLGGAIIASRRKHEDAEPEDLNLRLAPRRRCAAPVELRGRQRATTPRISTGLMAQIRLFAVRRARTLEAPCRTGKPRRQDAKPSRLVCRADLQAVGRR